MPRCSERRVMHAMSEFARSLDGKGASNTLRRHLVILDDQVTFLVHSMPDQPTLGSVDLDNLFDLVSVRIEHRSEEHTSELQSLMRTSYAVFCLTKIKPLQPTPDHN